MSLIAELKRRNVFRVVTANAIVGWLLVEVVAEIEADMAAQPAHVREMERNGELEPIPEVSATTR